MNVSVDVVVVTIIDNCLKVLLIRRVEEPYMGKLALPGVRVGELESLKDAAYRALAEEAVIRDDIHLEQLFTYGDEIGRDPRNRVVSAAYIALLNYEPVYGAGIRVSDAEFYDYDEVLRRHQVLAFDHFQILKDARERIRGKAEYTDLAFSLIGERFTLSQLQKIHEVLLGRKLYKANFRKKIIEKVEETGELTSGMANRPSKYYRKKCGKMSNKSDELEEKHED